MKKIIYSFLIIGAIVFTSCKSEKKETTKTETSVVLTSANFGVRGNCGMCKVTIEKAANSVDGVVTASWNKSKKNIDVEFDPKKTDAKAVETAIANSGYDTQNMMGSLDAYKELPECCKYDHDMKMNQTGDTTSKETH